MLVVDDSTLDKHYAGHIGLVTRHRSGKHHGVISSINLLTLPWADGDRKMPVDYRVFSKADGKTEHDHFREMLLMAKGRGFSPRYVLSDGRHASPENHKQVLSHGRNRLTRLKGNRRVTPEDRVFRSLDEAPFGDAGRVVHLRGSGPVLDFRIDAPDGVAEYWATGDLTMEAGVRSQHAELGFAIDIDYPDYHPSGWVSASLGAGYDRHPGAADPRPVVPSATRAA